MIRVGERVDTFLGSGVVVGHEDHYGEKFPMVQLDDPTRWACWDGIHHPIFRDGKEINIVPQKHRGNDGARVF